MSFLLTNLKHSLLTFTVLLTILMGTAVWFGADINYGDNPLAYKIGNEGPHLFFEGNQITSNYIRGNSKQGFYIDKKSYSLNEPISATVYFPLEDNSFDLTIDTNIKTPPTTYSDNENIVAISDIESSYKTFRNFLIANNVIDQNLNWTFGKGHLVLVGDFVDRGFSTTQVLWFIYKLEKVAEKAGGTVHFILGNHELKNLQGNYQKAAKKYIHVATALGKQQYELFDDNSFLGRWMASKNTMELINGYLFTHGGIHPDLPALGLSLDDINTIARKNYRSAWLPRSEAFNSDAVLSTKNGPSWYRGYFEADLSQSDIDIGANHFNAKAVIVGHQPQWSVNTLYRGKVIAIDVKHPFDYRGTFPSRSSEGLLIQNDQTLFKLKDDGSQTKL